MPTIEDLGKKIKAKFPGLYDDLSDAELGERIKAKYPGSYDDFIDMRVAKNPTSVMGQFIQYSTDAQTVANVQSLLDYYSPKRGRLTSWWQRGKAESRGKLLTVLNQEQLLVIQQGAILAEAIQNRTKTDSDFQVYITRNADVLLQLRLSAVLIEAALRQGLTVEIDQRLKLETGLSSIRVQEHRELKDIDLYVRETEYQQDQENVSRIQQEKLELIDRASHRLYLFYKQRKELQASDDPAKDDKLRHLNQLIHGAERLILGEQDRYIQATLGEEAPRGLQADDSGTGDSEAAEADEV